MSQKMLKQQCLRKTMSEERLSQHVRDMAKTTNVQGTGEANKFQGKRKNKNAEETSKA